MKKSTFGATAFIAFMLAGMANASADNLTLYCSADEAWCQLMARGFEEETGIKVDMTRKSSGETFAQVKAEIRQPQGGHLVGRHGRSAFAGCGRRSDRGICVSDARPAQ